MKEVTLADLKPLVDKGALLVDVREDEEVALGMIPGAKHFPLSRLDEFEDEISSAGPILFYCRSGKRSITACNAAEKWNQNELYSLKGGYLAYVEQHK